METSTVPEKAPGRKSSPATIARIGVVVVALVAIALSSVAIARSAPGAGAVSRQRLKVLLDSESYSALKPGATISVTGSGTVEGTPNTVSFTIGINTTEPSAAAALSDNDAQVRRLEVTLLRHGVLRKDMQTSNLDISPDTNSSGAITGFTADDDLDVQMSNTAKAGAAIDAGAEVAGNGIDLYGISFSISNESSLLARARASAMANARAEAAQVAAGAGLQLGPVEKVTDEENAPSSSVPLFQATSSLGASVPIEAGQQSLSVKVSVVYELRS